MVCVALSDQIYLIFIKAKKTHGFNSCIVISYQPLDIA